MRTELLEIKKIPNQLELVHLLGKNLFGYYDVIVTNIVVSLKPNLEIWDLAGRRGKYLHGFKIDKKFILIDLYLSKGKEKGYLSCEFKLQKKSINKLLKNYDFFSEETQINITSSLNAMNKYGGFYLNLIVNEKNIQETIAIIQLIS